MNTTSRRHADTEILPLNWRAARSDLPTHARMAGSCWSRNVDEMARTQKIEVI